MSTFFQVQLISIDHASANVLIDACQTPLLLRVAAAAKIKGASKLARHSYPSVLDEHLRSMGPAATASLLYETVFQSARLGEKRLLASVGKRMNEARFAVDDLVPNDKPEVASGMWLAQNLAHHFFPTTFAPLLRSECAFEVRATTNDVQVPSEREIRNRGSLAPQFASRLFRDAHRFVDAATEDASRNPWISEFGWDEMAKSSWVGRPPLDAAAIERPEPKTAIVRTISTQRWTAHLELHRVFAAAG
jgi:hypothetical protein